MKKYNNPELEVVMIVTENVTEGSGGGVSEGSDNTGTNGWD